MSAQDALAGVMAALAQYGDTRTLNATEKPLFVAAAKLAIKVRRVRQYPSGSSDRAQGRSSACACF